MRGRYLQTLVLSLVALLFSSPSLGGGQATKASEKSSNPLHLTERADPESLARHQSPVDDTSRPSTQGMTKDVSEENALPADADRPNQTAEEASPPLIPVLKTEKKTKLFVPSLKSETQMLDQEQTQTISGLIFYYLSLNPDLLVYSESDLMAVLDLEAQKQFLGCDDSSCLDELAGAMDVDLMITSHLGRLGNRFHLTLSMVDTRTAKTHKRVSIKVRRQAELPFKLRSAIHSLLMDYGGLPAADIKESKTSFADSIQGMANHPDIVMLMTAVAVSSIGVAVPLLALTPLLQAFAFRWLGGLLAGRTYPNWWMAPLIGYPVLLCAGGMTAGAWFLADYIWEKTVDPFLNGRSQGFRAVAGFATTRELKFTAAAGFFTTLFLIEPLLVWIVMRLGAYDTVDDEERFDDTLNESIKGELSVMRNRFLGLEIANAWNIE